MADMRPGVKPNVGPDHIGKPKRNRVQTPTTKPTERRFVTVVGHPAQFKDRSLMRANRKHVMMNYLAKTGQKPGDDDRPETLESNRVRPRIKNDSRRRSKQSISATKRYDNNVMPTIVTSISTTAPEEILCHDLPGNGNSAQAMVSISTHNDLQGAADVDEEIESPLVHAPIGTTYARTAISDVPYPVANPGSTVNPFDTWPTLHELDTLKLKHSCSHHFGSDTMRQAWIPTLLKARHAFLSTICVSAAHDDIMQRARLPIEEQTPYEFTDRFKVNSQVVGMINEAITDPQTRTTDATIIAVVQILSSEIMGCNDQTLAIHQRGLHDMVIQRGGLERLGIDGHLAMILTINMYMISALRETLPHRDFEQWASKTASKPSQHSRKIPESPVYCRPTGFESVKKTFASDDPTYTLLDTLRFLTNQFVHATGAALSQESTTLHAPVDLSPKPHILALCAHLNHFPPASRHPFFSAARAPHAFHTYEALRLTGRVYAHAIAHSLPLSTAASYLTFLLDPNDPGDDPSSPPAAPHVRIKYHLQRTDLSACWGDRAGVLFWTVLVAAAASTNRKRFPPDNLTSSYLFPTPSPPSSSSSSSSSPPTASSSSSPRTPSPDDLFFEPEHARKWLSAVAVRCSIVLGFEHGSAVLETLRRVVGVEQALAHAAAKLAEAGAGAGRGSAVAGETRAGSRMDRHESEERGGQMVVESGSMSSLGTKGSTKAPMGPEEAPFLCRRGNFADFAEDFREGMM